MICAEFDRPGGIDVLYHQFQFFSYLIGICDKLKFTPFHHVIQWRTWNDHERKGGKIGGIHGTGCFSGIDGVLLIQFSAAESDNDGHGSLDSRPVRLDNSINLILNRRPLIHQIQGFLVTAFQTNENKLKSRFTQLSELFIAFS
jgi:hypothetical protein